MRSIPWLAAAAGEGGDAADGDADGATAPESESSSPRPPLTEANERLNQWYDDFLFESMSGRLAEMAEGGA